MTDDRLPNSSLDDAIDRAVRDMTNVDPMPGFERRVMRRIDRPAPRRFGWVRLAAVASAVALLIVLGAVLTKKRTAPGANAATPPAVATTTPAQSAAEAPTVTPAAPSTIRRVPTTRPQHAPDPRLMRSAAAVNESPIHTIAALEPPDALGVHEMDARPVAVGEIAISHLEVRQLNVQPLQTLEERPKE